MSIEDEDDPLSAFFDEVSAAEEQVLKKDDAVEEVTVAEPSRKKLKLDETCSFDSTLVVPKVTKKIVVAAAVSTSYKASAPNDISLVPNSNNNIENNNYYHHTGQSQLENGGRSMTQSSTITAAAAAANNSNNNIKYSKSSSSIHNKQQPHLDPTKRKAGGQEWEDKTLAEFPPNDYRLFVGNLAKDIKLQQLESIFAQKYPSFAMARICTNKNDGKSRGYGFVSFLDAMDAARAIREMDQAWLGSRPIRVRKSDWMERSTGLDHKKDDSRSRDRKKKNRKR